eukprot:gene12116-2210_t
MCGSGHVPRSMRAGLLPLLLGSGCPSQGTYLGKPSVPNGAGFNYTILPHHLTHGRHGPDEPAGRARSGAYAVPTFHVDLSGDVVQVQDTVRVYYDGAAVAGSTLRVALHREGGPSVADCTELLEVTFEYASFALRDCVGDSLDASGDFEWQVSAARREGGNVARVQPLTRWVRQKDPWPLENDDGGWPPALPNLVGNLHENYQSFSGQDAAYWHEGLDIMSVLVGDRTYAQECHCPVDGEVVKVVQYNPSDLYWSVMVRDFQGFIWQFHHLDPATFRVKEGDPVSSGDVLGNVCNWPSSWNGVRYHHVHLNVVRPLPSWTDIPEPYVDGWQYFNPYLFFDNFEWQGGGKEPRSDGEMFFLPQGSDTALASSSDAAPPSLFGKIDVVMSWESEFGNTNSIGGQPYPNGLFAVGYSVEEARISANTSAVARFRREDLSRHRASSSKSSGKMVIGSVSPQYLLAAPKLPNEWDFCLPELRVADNDAMLRRVYKQGFSYQSIQYSS